MATHAIGLFAPARSSRSPGEVVLGIRVRLQAGELDRRLASDQAPQSDRRLAVRAGQLTDRRMRRSIADGLARVSAVRSRANGISAAIPVDREAVQIARPALGQLAAALRSGEPVRPQGVAIAHVLLTEPFSALYHPAHRNDLYEAARAALLALAEDGPELPTAAPGLEAVTR